MSSDNVVELKPKKKEGTIKISKVYAKGVLRPDGTNDWAFNVSVGNNEPRGYAFGNRTDAVKGRVLFQKKIKAEGYSVQCSS